ncbi:MAG: hypothetical protein AAF950_12115 [Pseudomonadota bacterium]
MDLSNRIASITTVGLFVLTLSGLAGCSVAGATAGAVTKVGTTAASITTRTAVGGAKLSARGATAVLTDDPSIPERTLQARAAEAIGARRGDVRVSDIYEDLNRTDYTASVRGTPFQCAVIEVEGRVSDAACVLGLVE